MMEPKHPVSHVDQTTQNVDTSTRGGFKEIDLKIAYRALIEGFLRSGMEETDNDQNQGAKPDDGNS